MYDFGSLDTGSKGVKNGAFRLFLEKYRWDDADFGVPKTSYGTWYVCEVWANVWFRFSRYGVKRGPEWSFSRVSRKVCIRFQWLSQKNMIDCGILLLIYHLGSSLADFLSKLTVICCYWLDMGSKGVKSGVFRLFLEKYR